LLATECAAGCTWRSKANLRRLRQIFTAAGMDLTNIANPDTFDDQTG
jgi:hypothetical protein